MTAGPGCLPGERRAHDREIGLGGIAGVEVDNVTRTIRVLLFGKAPRSAPGLADVHIGGPGRLVRPVAVDVTRSRLASRYDELVVTLDRLGDRSTYTVFIGPSADQPMAGFDPRYSHADFTFTADCGGEADCGAGAPCPPADAAPAVIDYLAKDYASFRQLMFDRLALTSPAWADRQIPDLGITLVELLAYVGDQLSYRQDAVATEAYLATARLRTSVRRHLRLVDYRMHDGCNARTWVHLDVEEAGVLPAGAYRFVTALPGYDGRPLLSAGELRRFDPAGYQVYEPVLARDLAVHPARNRIQLWTWGAEECCLPRGATAATLVDSDGQLGLKPGDVLILEEVRNPRTGLLGDADVRHRQAVRLTGVEETTDPAYDQQLLQVSWAEGDALAFPLCLAAVGGEECCLIADVSVARGNVILVDHGRTEPWCGESPGTLTVPQAAPGTGHCAGLGRPYRELVTLRFAPRLAPTPLTRRSAYPDPAAVAASQALLLRRIPDEADRAIRRILRAAAGDDLEPADQALLRVLRGAVADPDVPLQVLVARGRVQLTRRLARLARLVAGADTGTPLDRDAAAEVAAAWGDYLTAGLDPADAAVAGPASTALVQEPATALEQLWLASGGETWAVRPDLVDSGPDDPHVVVEADDEGISQLRFGDGELGRAVTAGQRFEVRLRVGNGTAGNVGPEALAHLVTCQPIAVPVTGVRNPLAAAGGVDPEPVADARLRGPIAYRHGLVRAVTAEDYATIAGAVPGVQGAATDLAWTGSWYEADVAVDPLGRAEPTTSLLDIVRTRLQQVRRIGHDLRVDPPRLVPVDVTVRVCLEPNAHRGAVVTALRARLGAMLDPDVLTFGSDLYASRFVAQAMAVPGVVSASVVRLARAGAPGPATPPGGVLAFGPLELPAGGGDPAGPAIGVLTIDPVGGR
jgi:predicted phage baseplate assembly protein